jgi:hypothetical protein
MEFFVVDLLKQYIILRTKCNTVSMYFSVTHLSIKKSIRLHNSLPSEIKKLDDFKKFKQALRFFLLDNPFYSLTEFFYICSIELVSPIESKILLLKSCKCPML